MPTSQQQTIATRLSPFHYKQASIGAKFSPYEFGWVRAEQFTEPAKEREAAERGVGIADLSHLTKLQLNGRGLTQVIEKRYPTVDNYGKGQAIIEGSGPNKNVLCAMLSLDEAMLIFHESLKEQVTKDLAADQPTHFTFVDVSSVLAGCCVVGPNGRALLWRLTELNVNPEDFSNLSVTHTPIRHVPAIILRNDVGALLGYQLYFERAYAEFIWDVVFSAGKELGAVPVGSSAMKLLGLSLG